MQDNTNCHWKKHPPQHDIIFPKRTIIHPHLDVAGITYFQDTPKSVCNRIQEKSHTKTPYFLIDDPYDYISDGIEG